MAKKVSKKTTTPVETLPVEPAPVEPAPVENTSVEKASTKKKIVKKKVVKKENVETKPEEIPVETPVEESIKEEAPIEIIKEEVPIEPKKKAKKITKEDIQQKWDELFEVYKNELKVKKTPEQSTTLLKFLTSLKNDTFKALKLKTRNVSNTDKNNSGFMKPVNVSDELRNFIDINNNDPVTRVLITQKLCQYIKENKLQKPEDKREIIPDEKMKKLFDIQPNESEKLTYYSMQRRVQRHIFKLDV